MKKGAGSFFSAFVGEHIRVATNVSATSEVHTEEGVATHSIPLTFDGTLVDLDDYFLLMGSADGSITHAIRIDSIVFVEIITEEHEGMELLDAAVDVNRDKMN